MSESPLVCWRVMCTASFRMCRFVGYRMLPANAKMAYYLRKPGEAQITDPCPRCGSIVRPDGRKHARDTR